MKQRLHCKKLRRLKKLLINTMLLLNKSLNTPLSNGVLQYFNFDYSKAYYRLQNCHILLHNNAKHIISALKLQMMDHVIATLNNVYLKTVKVIKTLNFNIPPSF